MRLKRNFNETKSSDLIMVKRQDICYNEEIYPRGLYHFPFSDPSGRNGEMDIQSIADLSLDDYTFDQHIDARSQSNNTSRRHGTEVLGQVRTVDGQVLTTENTGTDNVGFIRVKTRPTSDENAYFKNILPVPALDCYAGTPPPSEKVGKFVKHPEYLATNYRLLSYYEYEWPLQEPNPARLANAGFFYTGMYWTFLITI